MVEGKILELIPQRPPFVMVDELVSHDRKNAQCTFCVPGGNIFIQDGLFSGAGMLECMAQTAAAWTGFSGKERKKNPAIGYIGAVNHLEVISLPRIGDLLRIDIEVINQIFDAIKIRGQVSKSGGQLLSQCEMMVFIDKK